MEDGAFCNDDTKGNGRLAPKFAGLKRRKKNKRQKSEKFDERVFNELLL